MITEPNTATQKANDGKTTKQPHGVDVHVGGRVRLRRRFLGLSQTELATAVGVTFQQVQKYERGFNRVSASKLYEISKVLKVPLASFFEGLDSDDTPVDDGRTTTQAEGYMNGEPVVVAIVSKALRDSAVAAVQSAIMGALFGPKGGEA